MIQFHSEPSSMHAQGKGFFVFITCVLGALREGLKWVQIAHLRPSACQWSAGILGGSLGLDFLTWCTLGVVWGLTSSPDELLELFGDWLPHLMYPWRSLGDWLPYLMYPWRWFGGWLPHLMCLGRSKALLVYNHNHIFKGRHLTKVSMAKLQQLLFQLLAHQPSSPAWYKGNVCPRLSFYLTSVCHHN